MKASELVKLIEAQIAEHGDHDVVYMGHEGPERIEDAGVREVYDEVVLVLI